MSQCIHEPSLRAVLIMRMSNHQTWNHKHLLHKHLISEEELGINSQPLSRNHPHHSSHFSCTYTVSYEDTVFPFITLPKCVLILLHSLTFIYRANQKSKLGYRKHWVSKTLGIENTGYRKHWVSKTLGIENTGYRKHWVS
jgi:hypothetical protein